MLVEWNEGTPPGVSECLRVLYVECAERGNEYGIPFISSQFCEYSYLEYVRIHVTYRVSEAEGAIHILVVAPQVNVAPQV